MSARIISVPVLYDGNGNFLNGQTIEVSAESIVVGTAPKPSGPSIPGFPVTLVDTLQIKDPTIGTLFLSITFAQWFTLASGYNPFNLPYQTIKSITVPYTLQSLDNQSLLLASGGLGNITVPADSEASFPVGYQVDIIQTDDGGVSFIGSTTINSFNGNATIAGAYAAATIEKLGPDNWVLIGNLIP